MQLPKISLVFCTLALAVAVRAEDSPAQAAARAALASKLFELGAQAPATNPPAKPVQKAAKPAPTVVEKPAPVVVVQTPGWDATNTVKTTDDAAAKAQAKADAERAVAELKAKRLAEKQASEQKKAEIAAAKAQAKAKANAELAKPVSGGTIVTQTTDTPAQAKAREALARSLFELSSQSTPPAAPPTVSKPVAPAIVNPEPKPAIVAPAPAPIAVAPAETAPAPVTTPVVETPATVAPVTVAPVVEASSTVPPVAAPVTVAPTTPVVVAPVAETAPAAPPMVVAPVVIPEPAPVKPAKVAPMPSYTTGYIAPPLPFNAEQQQRLAELLAKYKTDLITPEEYQKQRAAILAK